MRRVREHITLGGEEFAHVGETVVGDGIVQALEGPRLTPDGPSSSGFPHPLNLHDDPPACREPMVAAVEHPAVAARKRR